MNGPVKMYRTRQIVQHDLKMSLPTCMYKLKNIHASSEKTNPLLGDHVSSAQRSVDISEQVKQFLKNLQHSPEMSALVERQERILKQLDDLRRQMVTLKSDLGTTTTISTSFTKLDTTMPNVIINAAPTHPPYSLLLLQKLLGNHYSVNVTSHVHSSVTDLPETAVTLISALTQYSSPDNKPIINVRLIWKAVGSSTELIVSQIPIIGEVNILRYFARVVPQLLPYENLENVHDIDSTLDVCYSLVRAKTKTERNGLLQSLNKKLGKSNWLCGQDQMTIVDVAAFTAIKQVALNEINQNISKWLERCNSYRL